MTGFAKTNPNRTRIEIQFILKLHTCTILRHQAYGYRWLSLFLQPAFHQPCQTTKCTTGPVEPMGDINKDVCGAKLLPTSILACAVNCSRFCYLMKTQQCCLCPCGKYNLPPAAHPTHYPPHTSHPLTPLCVPSMILAM